MEGGGGDQRFVPRINDDTAQLFDKFKNAEKVPGKTCELAVLTMVQALGGKILDSVDLDFIARYLEGNDVRGDTTACRILEYADDVRRRKVGWGLVVNFERWEFREVVDTSQQTGRETKDIKVTLQKFDGPATPDATVGISIKCSNSTTFKQGLAFDKLPPDAHLRQAFQYLHMAMATRCTELRPFETDRIRSQHGCALTPMNETVMSFSKIVIGYALCIVFDRPLDVTDPPLFGAPFLSQVDWPSSGPQEKAPSWGAACTEDDPATVLGLSHVRQIQPFMITSGNYTIAGGKIVAEFKQDREVLLRVSLHYRSDVDDTAGLKWDESAAVTSRMGAMTTAKSARLQKMAVGGSAEYQQLIAERPVSKIYITHITAVTLLDVAPGYLECIPMHVVPISEV